MIAHKIMLMIAHKIMLMIAHKKPAKAGFLLTIRRYPRDFRPGPQYCRAKAERNQYS